MATVIKTLIGVREVLGGLGKVIYNNMMFGNHDNPHDTSRQFSGITKQHMGNKILLW